MRKKITGIVLILLTLCLFTGCPFAIPMGHLSKIKGDITCDFHGVCWENDNYSLWVYRHNVNFICYRMQAGESQWGIKEDARKPDYMKGRYD